VRFELRRSTDMRKAERLRINGAPSNENGQATSCPAVSVKRGVHIDHQAFPQTAFLPFGGRDLPHRAAGARQDFGKSLTRCCGLVRPLPQDVGDITSLPDPGPFRDVRGGL